VGDVALKRVLLIAFQYPPMTGTSGIQRALRFSQYLPEFGWEPVVLTAHPRAYEKTGSDQMRDIPAGVHVERAFALDTARHLAIMGRYPRAMAVPDRWMSWRLGAVVSGVKLIREFQPAAIWSTFPIPTAHRIGLSLHRRTGLPWIADFRDVMTEDQYPTDPDMRENWRALEERVIASCTYAVFTTPGAANMYADRYPSYPHERFAVIENGYDEELFSRIERDVPSFATNHVRLRLVHSGVIYPSERDPVHLFSALRELKAEGGIDAQGFELVLRATGHDAHINRLIAHAGIGDLVAVAPPVPYREALAEMVAADGLLLLQADNCNRQIPAKLYEYLRSGRPILGLASGDTANALQAAGIDTVAALEDKEAIKRTVKRFVNAVRAGAGPIATAQSVTRHARKHKAAELAELLRSASPDRAING